MLDLAARSGSGSGPQDVLASAASSVRGLAAATVRVLGGGVGAAGLAPAGGVLAVGALLLRRRARTRQRPVAAAPAAGS